MRKFPGIRAGMKNGSSIAARMTSASDSDSTISRCTSPTQEPIAYAALEQQQADPSSFRIYLVFDPQHWSFEALGAFLYQQLLRDTQALQAAKLVCIEYATSTAFCAFLERQDFQQVGDAVYNGFNIVRYEKRLLPVVQE